MPDFDWQDVMRAIDAPIPGEDKEPRDEDVLGSVYAPLPEPHARAESAGLPVTKPEDLAENQGTFAQIGSAFRKAYENGELSDAALAAVQGGTFNFGDELTEMAASQLGHEQWGKEAGARMRQAPKDYPYQHGAGSLGLGTAAGVAAAAAAPVLGVGLGAAGLLGGAQGLLSGLGAQEGEKSFLDALDEGLLGALGGVGGGLVGKGLSAAGGALARGGKGLYNKLFPGPAPAPRPAPTMHIEPVDPLEDLLRRRGMNPEEMTGGMAMPPGGLKGQGPRTFEYEMVPETGRSSVVRGGMSPQEMAGGMTMPPGGLRGQAPRSFSTEMVPEPAPDPIMRGRGQYEINPREPEPDFLGMDVRRATPVQQVPVEGPMPRGQGGRFMPRQLREVGGERVVPPYEGPLPAPPPPTPPSMVPGPVSVQRGPQGPVSPLELPPEPPTPVRFDPSGSVRGPQPPPRPIDLSQGAESIYGMREVPPPLPVPPPPGPKAPPPRDLPGLGSIGQDLYRGRFIPAAGKAVEHLGAFAERMRTPSAPETLAPQASLLGRAGELAAGKAAWELGAPYVAGGKPVYAQEGGQETAYAGRSAMNYAVQAALTRGASLGLSEADEAALTKAVVEGNDRAISAQDFRLRQQYPAYAREVERELREMNDEQ